MTPSDLRVLHLIPSLGCGGAERQLEYLTAALGRAGVDTHVGFFWKGMHFERIAGSAAGCHWLRTRSNHDPRNTAKVLALIRSVQPDVVQTWLPPMDIHVGLVAPLLAAPWIISERASSGLYGRNWKSALRHMLAGQAAAVVANSPDGLACWADRRGIAVRRCIPNIIPFEDIAGAPRIPPAAASFSKNGRLLLVVGRLAPEKNVARLLRALHLVLERNVDVTVQMIGDGPLAPAVERELVIWHPRLRWIRESQEVWSWLKFADVCVSVSLYEGSPNAVLEAVQCGCPLVLSDIAAHRETVATERAVFVSPFDPQLIATAIEQALARQQPRAFDVPCDSAGHSMTAVVHSYIALYEQLAGAARSTGRGRDSMLTAPPESPARRLEQ